MNRSVPRFCSIAATSRKLIKARHNRPLILSQRERNAALELKAQQMGLEWRHVGATVLHRYPVITADLEPWEEEMCMLHDKIDSAQRENFVDKVDGTEAMIIPSHNPTYEEILETLPFKPAPRITEADDNNDRRSLERKLARSVLLIVKRNRDDKAWQFPQGKCNDKEILRQTAERVIDRAIGRTHRYFMSSSPIGHYMYEYPAALQQQRNQFGAKIYFYRAQLLEGSVKLETRLYTDFAWIGREEVGDYFDKDMSAYLSALLPL